MTVFLEHAYQFAKGYVILKIEGYFVERFLNLCTHHQMIIWNLEKSNEVEVTLKAFQKDMKEFEKIANITKCKITVMSQKGIPKLIKQYRKRKSFLYAIAGGIFLLYEIGIRVWQIEIVGNFTIPIDELYQELQMENVRIGMRKKDIDFSSLFHINIGKNICCTAAFASHQNG